MTLRVFGVSVEFAGGFVAEIRQIGLSGQKREAIDTSHAETPGGDMTSLPSMLIDNGEIEVEMHYDPDKVPPIKAEPANCKIKMPAPPGKSTGAILESDAYLIDYAFQGQHDGKFVANCKIKRSGPVVVTPSAA